MILHHFSPSWNVPKILAGGLLVRKHKGALAGIWFCTRQLRGWALSHVARHQAVGMHQLAEIVAEVPRAWLARRRRGVWICTRDVPAARLRSPVEYL